jgi:hypothetical protein
MGVVRCASINPQPVLEVLVAEATRILVTALLLGFPFAVSHAQGGINGRVVDEQSAPIEGALVQLATSPIQEARTDVSGRFAFLGIGAGSYRLQVRRLGFLPVTLVAAVRDSATVFEVRMRRVASTLPQVVVRGRWQGIFGTVADSQSQLPLANVLVRIIGVSSSIRTDSLGAFVADVKQPGAYVIRLERDGYRPRTMTVRVAKDSASEILSTLSEGNAGDARNQILWREFDSRTRMRGFNSSFVTANELAAVGTESPSQALTRSRSFAIKNLKLNREICLYVNGEPKPGWTMDAFDVSEILAIEVYGRRGELTNTLVARWPRGEPCGPGTGISPVRLSEAERRLQVQAVNIWLKKQ